MNICIIVSLEANVPIENAVHIYTYFVNLEIYQPRLLGVLIGVERMCARIYKSEYV